MNTLIWIFIALLMIAVDILVVEVIFIEKELGASLKVIDKYMDTILLIITDMTGISETDKELDRAERKVVLEELFPKAVLADYEQYAFPIEQLKRLQRHPWAYKMVWFLERSLFKLEKAKRKKNKVSKYE